MGRNNIERSHLFMYVRSKLDPIADKVLATLLPGGEIQAGLNLCHCLHGGKGHGCVTALNSGIGYDLGTQSCWGDYIDLGRQLWNCTAEESALRIMTIFGLKVLDFNREIASKTRSTIVGEICDNESIFPPPPISPALPKTFPALGEPLEIWPYFNEQGRLLFYIAYFPAYSGKVKRVCISLYRKIDGCLRWFVGSPPSYQVYNQPKIRSAYSETVIIFVRRESYVHLSESLFPEVVATTWSQGLRNLDVTLIGHSSVLIWPEVSLHGCAAALILSEKLSKQGNLHCILNTPAMLPEGWDLGSPLPEGVSHQDLYAKLEHSIPIHFREMANARYPTLQRTIHSLGFRDVEYL